MNAIRRPLLLVAAVLVGLCLAGCRSTWDFWKEDMSETVKAQNKNFHKIHKSLDRHFLNYDWDDPYLD